MKPREAEWVMIRVYKLPKKTTWGWATIQFKQVEEKGELADLMVYEKVREDKPKSLWKIVLDQITG